MMEIVLLLLVIFMYYPVLVSMLTLYPQANLAITCVYTFIFIILIALCAITFGITRGNHLPYTCLLVSLVFSVIAAIALIVRLVVSSNGERGVTLPGSTIVAMMAMEEFFGDWAPPFLFFSFCLLLRARFHINAASEGQTRKLSPAVWTIGYTTVSVLLLIFGAALTGLYTNYINAIFFPNGRIGHTIKELNNLATVYSDVLYTYDAIWYSSTFVVGGLAVHTYKAMSRTGVFDKVGSLLILHS